MSAHKIVEGIKAAIAGDISRVTIDGQVWERRAAAPQASTPRNNDVAVTIEAPPIPPILQREWMAEALFEVDAPDHLEWADVVGDKRERFLSFADVAISRCQKGRYLRELIIEECATVADRCGGWRAKDIAAEIRTMANGATTATATRGDLSGRLLDLARVMGNMDGRTMCIQSEDGFIDDGVFVADDHLPTVHDAIRLVEAQRSAAITEAPVAWQEPTEAQLSSACMSYRHDYGLLDATAQQTMNWQAKEWLIAWRKEGFGCDRNEVIERCAAVVDKANKEGPYQAIAAASRIRALKGGTDPRNDRGSLQPITSNNGD